MDGIRNRSGEFEEVLETSDSSCPTSSNGAMITLIVATIPVVTLCLIILGFKICYKLCPQGQRSSGDFQLPRRISTFSTMSTMFSTSRASSIHQMPQAPCPTGALTHHSQLHHVQPIIHHHHHYAPVVRTDGTPLVAIELGTISEQNGMEPDFDDDLVEEVPLTKEGRLGQL